MTREEFEVAVLTRLTDLSAAVAEVRIAQSGSAQQVQHEIEAINNRIDRVETRYQVVLDGFERQRELWESQLKVCGTHLNRTLALEERTERHSREVDFVEGQTQAGQEESLRRQAAAAERARLMRIITWLVGLLVGLATLAGTLWAISRGGK